MSITDLIPSSRDAIFLITGLFAGAPLGLLLGALMSAAKD